MNGINKFTLLAQSRYIIAIIIDQSQTPGGVNNIITVVTELNSITGLL